jgi:putative protein-disulfide isomerase
MTPTLYYCYDAYCGWCYGFSPVIKKIYENYKDKLAFEVLPGGMILPEKPQPIGVMASYIKDAYKIVEGHTGIRFGKDWLWHILHPDESDWYPSSEKPAVALCVLKDYHPELAILFAGDLQYALHEEGRDLTDDEAYRHLLEKYRIPDQEFYQRLHDPVYKAKAYEEFALVKQLGITGFPTLLLQVSESRMYLLARGYTHYDSLQDALERAMTADK